MLRLACLRVMRRCTERLASNDYHRETPFLNAVDKSCQLVYLRIVYGDSYSTVRRIRICTTNNLFPECFLYAVTKVISNTSANAKIGQTRICYINKNKK